MGRYFLPAPERGHAPPHRVHHRRRPEQDRQGGPGHLRPGNPTRPKSTSKVPLDSDETQTPATTAATDRAVPNANALKAQGSHVLAVAVGNGLSNPASLAPAHRRLRPERLPGHGHVRHPDRRRVPRSPNFATRGRPARRRLPAVRPSVNIRKLVDANPDPAVDDLQPAGLDHDRQRRARPPALGAPGRRDRLDGDGDDGRRRLRQLPVDDRSARSTRPSP